ncbi:hypothetical protein BWQ96_06473 [Gracilariopsis chorda]|uniref:Uncharacterized protein n=1 Tax=Gracilariopsis chorda TaxID=448386 RepID=A0A2V3IRK0_9FLOR|nr:hypothetical protein BWQ96_06473 [Gracilariopsis chorda]|eukprot:PXF43780.1 hypothetical protein BWQ96_06473 [Gracilariopsis chorda]
MPTLWQSKELSFEAIGQELQALLESLTSMSELIRQIGEDQTLATVKEVIEVFAENSTKIREEIVSLTGLMIHKLQSMMQHFEGRNKMKLGPQKDILRMLHEFASDIDESLVRGKERSERARKQVANVSWFSPFI